MRYLIIILLLTSMVGRGQVTIDSYATSNYNSTIGSYAGYAYLYQCQSFTNVNAITLDSCKFYIYKSGSPTGSCYATVYAHTGTYGTSSTPTGAVLATSDAKDVSTLPTSIGLVKFTFSGANKISLSANTYYTVVFYFNGGNSTNYVRMGVDTSGEHSGNYCYSGDASTWTAISARDAIFYVYGSSAATTGKNTLMQINF